MMHLKTVFLLFYFCNGIVEGAIINAIESLNIMNDVFIQVLSIEDYQ